MDLDDLDIYEDLDTFQKEEEKKTVELLSLEAKYNDSLKTIETLQVENAELKKQIRRIGINFQNLLDTAKAEIKRKDKQIEQLRKEKDDICFRRKQPRREYTDVASTSQNTNAWFRNESVLPAHDFESNTNANVQRSKATIETIENEQLCTTSYTTSGRENAQISGEYNKAERRDERSERKYDSDPQREKYNRNNNQRDQHVSRHRAHSNDRDGNVRSGTRDYSRSHDSRTADRSRRDERDIRNKNKLYTNEKEKESYNSTENGRRQHSYDRLSDRSRYHSKEEKTKSENYNSRYDRRSDHKEEKCRSESYDGRPDRRSDFKKHREDSNKKSKDINEKVCEKYTNMNKNEDVDSKSDDTRGKSSKPSESKSANKSNEKHKLSERSHTETMSTETVEYLAFLGKNLPASKDPKILEKVLAEEKLNKEKLLTLECESPHTKTDKNANRLMPADGMTTPKKTALLDKLFGSTPTNASDINSNTLSNVIGILTGNNSSATSSPSNYTDTSESTIISYANNCKNTESDEYYIPINVDQSKHNKNEIRVVSNNDNKESNDGLIVETKPQELISCVTSKNQAADASTFTKLFNSVKTTDEMVDYAKIATSILSEDEDQTEVEQGVETVSICNDEAAYNAQKTNDNKTKGGIKILENVRLPNIYEIRAHQRRLREAAAAKKAKRALTAKTKDVQQNATQNTTKMLVPVLKLCSKDLEKNPTNTAENTKAVGLQEGCVEIKNQQDEECSLGNSTQINVSASTDSNAITFNNEKTIKESRSETSNNAEQHNIEYVKLSDKNLSSLLAAAAIIETAEKSLNSNTLTDDAAVKQMKSDAICTNHQNENEESIRSKNIEKPEEMPNAAEIDDIELKQGNVHCQRETEETISNEVNTNVKNTLEIVGEETNIQNEAKYDRTSIEMNIKSAVSPTTDYRNKKNQSEDFRMSSSNEAAQTSIDRDMPDSNLLTKVMPANSEQKNSSIESKANMPTINFSTEAEQTFTNKDMANINSSLLTKVIPDDSEQKKSIVESEENILKSQALDESKDEVSQNRNKAENNTVIASVEEESEKSCEQNVGTEQESSAEIKKMVEQKVGLTQGVGRQECKKLIEPLKTANESMNKTQVVLENTESKCEMVLSKDKREENGLGKHDVVSEQKNFEQSEVEITEPKKAVESAVDKSVELLESTEVDSQECKKLIAPLKTANESMIKTQVVSENPESKCDKMLSKDKREENALGKHDVVSEQKTVKQSEVEITEPKKAVESAVDKSEELLESTETNIANSGVIENCITESNAIVIPDVTTSIISDTERSECSTNVEMSNDNNSIIVETDLSEITENDTNTVAIEKSESTIRNDICAEIENVEIAGGKQRELHETDVVVPYSINNKDSQTKSCLAENETILAVQNVPKREPKSVAESKEIKLHTKIACTNKHIKSKKKELSNAVNMSAERNIIVENMKRAEVLWKFKIPKLSAKRKREESVDSTSSKECKNTGSDAIKREKLCNNTDAPLIPHMKKKSTKLIAKHMSDEKKVLEINANIEKNFLETKTLFEDQKKSERIIKEIDNWARRKVGDKAEILETDIQMETAHKQYSSNLESMSNMTSKDEISTDMKVLNTPIKQKTDKQKAHRATNSECTSTDTKCVSENHEEYKKPPQTSPRDKGNKTHTKGQNAKFEEHRKSNSKVEDEHHTHGSKPRNIKYNVETHKEKSQTNRRNNDKCEKTCSSYVTAQTAQCGEVQTQMVGNSENENNTVKKSPVSGELGDKSKKNVHTTIENENNTVKRELESEDKSKKCTNAENITSKLLVEVAISSKITKVKKGCSKELPDNLNQKKESDRNEFVSKRKSIEAGERETDNHEKRAKSDVGVGKKEIVQIVTETEASSTEITEVATSGHDTHESSNIETTKYNQSVAATFAQTPKRRRTVGDTSSDDSEVMSKPRRRKHCKMRIQDSDDEEASLTLPTTMRHPPVVNHVDSERKNKDIIDILQNDRVNESNDNLPAPQTPTSLPANISQDAAYEEIDSRMQLMFASPKPADKTSTISTLTVASQVKTQLLQPTLADSAVATGVTDTDVPPENDLSVTKAPVGDTKPPADFSITDTLLSDISANSFLASDMNVTINETNHSGMNANSSFSDSNVSTKHISLGSSDYRFEKVSENVVNLFITRKRRGKRKSTATITTNTVSAT